VRIIISGVCGFIGSHLAKRLIAMNYDVIGIDDLSTGTLLNIKKIENHTNFSFYETDILNREELSLIFQKHSVDCLFHLAALPRIGYSFINPEKTYRVNVDGTKNITDIAIENNIKKIIFTSSSSVYGAQNSGAKFMEDQKPAPISPYAKQKLLAEKYIREKFKETNGAVFILRLFNVYGFSYLTSTDFFTLIPRILSDLAFNRQPNINNDGCQERDFTYIDDVMDAMLQTLDISCCNEIINIGTGIKFSVNFVYEAICKELKKSIKPKYSVLHYPEPKYTCADNAKASKLLNWRPKYSFGQGIKQTVYDYQNREKIVLSMPLRNAGNTVRRAVLSIINQQQVQRKLMLVIGNDGSNDDWKQRINDLISDNLIIIDIVDGGKSYKVRKRINEYILDNIKNIGYIGRLDADDELADELVISRLERIMERHQPDVIMAGNYQRKEDKIIAKNMPGRNLLNPACLLERLRKMSLCLPEAELPSCNILVKPELTLNYPSKESADDHWFMVELLLKSDTLKIHIAEELIYSIYSLSGNITKLNKINRNFFYDRKELYEYATQQLQSMTGRNKTALALLQQYKKNEYLYLGEGAEGVVYTDNHKVYKVYDALSDTKYALLKAYMPLFQKALHTYEIEDIIKIDGKYILIYPYEYSVPIKEIKEDEFISFLAEAWQLKLIFRDIKPENLIRVNGVIKIIDLELNQYTDNLFLNMCVRAFIYIKYYGQDKKTVDIIARSAINNFDLPELDGVREFVNRVFSTIIFRESKSAVNSFVYRFSPNSDALEIAFNQLGNIDLLFYSYLSEGFYIDRFEVKDIELNDENYFEPANIKLYYRKVKPFRRSVSLIIKTCPQDYETIYVNVKHIVKQLSSPNVFLEKIISIDTREKKFLREYTSKGTLISLEKQIKRLMDEKIVDEYIIPPIEAMTETNYRWFGLKVDATHSINEAPVTPHLYVFEQARGEYIFQMDSDVMIARKDLSHSYLEDMVSEMEKNENVVSVGFNICQHNDIKYKPYFGFEDGGFVPEVRMGLFHKKRLFSLLPLSNSLDESGKWRKTWHRAMHQKQRETGFCSIRGGDSRSFFIHPQNYRKTKPDIWTTVLDRVGNGCIPLSQQNEFDCAGSYYDWTIPKRNEELVIICLVRNLTYPRFLKMFCSVISQTYENWGMVLIDDASDNGLPFFIDTVIQSHYEKITFIKNRVRQGGTANIYKAIHYFTSNSESIIMTIDGDDAIIGNTVFEKIVETYRKQSPDVLIGGMYQTYRLQAHYRYPINFVNPRSKDKDSNVWQHIRTFKKYLFDSLEIRDLKNTNYAHNGIEEIISNSWLPDCTDYAMMIPIIEMSRYPLQIHNFTYYHDRAVTEPSQKAIKERCIADILNKKPKSNLGVFKKRKFFLPNLNRIEIDITYECNLKCIACNRSCAQLPTDEKMDFSDVKKFIIDSIRLNKRWELINILGGEPTLHPEFEQIIKHIAEEYISQYSPKTILQITSNGFTVQTRDILEKVKNYDNVIIDYKSFKNNNQAEYFSPFNDAPIDDEKFNNADYIKGCWVTSYCGIGLNRYGYYACSICGGIDRVINNNRGGIRNLDEINIYGFQKQLSQFCRFCGNFKDYDLNHGDLVARNEKAPFKNIVSESWRKLYRLAVK
jgi:nucleoside-diphosphate-sugar epimerase/uncharacterized radical SAM superfamily Fe-S cluster-containing enzyme